jgi:ABC-2 type transport system permease protein
MSEGLKREWHLFVRAPGSLLLLAVLAILAAIGAINGVQRVQAQRQLAHTAQLADVQSFAAKRAALVDLEAGRTEEGQFGSARKAHQAILSAGRPITPVPAELPVLSTATRPTPDLLSVSILTRHVDQQPRLDDPSNRLDGPFDLLFVTTWLLPLFALVLGCDVLAGDRERGSAALLASQGTPLGIVLGRRLAVRFGALFTVVALIALVAVMVTEWTNLGRGLAALGGWLPALAMFLAFWLALAAIVNVFARSAATAALALLCAWIAFSVVIPALSGSVVHALAPPPDRLKGVLAMRDIDADLNRRRTQVTAAYYAAHPDNAPVREGDEYEHYFVTELYPRVLSFDAAYAPIAQSMDMARVRQLQALRMAAVASPVQAFRLLSEDLAGLAPERRIAFFQGVDDFQRRWRTHFDHKLASMRPLTSADYDSKPEYRAAAEPGGARWMRLAWLLVALALPVVVVVVIAARRARRVSPLGAS